MTAPGQAEALLRAARFLKWWRDGHIAEAEPPDDLADVIVALEQLAEQLERGVPDEWQSVEPRPLAPPPEDE